MDLTVDLLAFGNEWEFFGFVGFVGCGERFSLAESELEILEISSLNFYEKFVVKWQKKLYQQIKKKYLTDALSK